MAASVQRDIDCPPTIDCITESATIDVASVDVGGCSLTSTSGNRYIASGNTRFHPTEIPTDPCPNLVSWNALTRTNADLRGYLALMIPPSPVIPPSPIRYAIVANVNILGRCLTDVTPIVPAC